MTDETVVKFCYALILLQKKIVAEDTLESMMLKFIAFRDSQEGNNEQAVSQMIFGEMNRLIALHHDESQNAHDDEEINVLVMRMALLSL